MNKRSAGFDLLKILSMIMIIMLHLLGEGHGEVLKRLEPYSAGWFTMWGIEALCIVAVNCYVLISGYYLCELEFSWNRVKRICVQVWFYSAVIGMVLLCIGRIELNLSNIFAIFFPLCNRTYWFASSYFGMLMLSPFINKLTASLSRDQHKRLIILVVCLFSVLGTVFPQSDTFQIGGGSGLVWLCVLYVIAAYIRRYGIRPVWNRRKWFLSYFALCLLIATSKFAISCVTKKILGNSIGTSIMYGYTSPLCLGAAVSLFMTFCGSTRFDRSNSVVKALLTLSKGTFGVYLIHDNPLIRPILWNYVNVDTEKSLVILLISSMALVLSIFAAGEILDAIRRAVFLLVERIIGKIRKQPVRD